MTQFLRFFILPSLTSAPSVNNTFCPLISLCMTWFWWRWLTPCPRRKIKTRTEYSKSPENYEDVTYNIEERSHWVLHGRCMKSTPPLMLCPLMLWSKKRERNNLNSGQQKVKIYKAIDACSLLKTLKKSRLLSGEGWAVQRRKLHTHTILYFHTHQPTGCDELMHVALTMYASQKIVFQQFMQELHYEPRESLTRKLYSR